MSPASSNVSLSGVLFTTRVLLKAGMTFIGNQRCLLLTLVI